MNIPKKVQISCTHEDYSHCAYWVSEPAVCGACAGCDVPRGSPLRLPDYR